MVQSIGFFGLKYIVRQLWRCVMVNHYYYFITRKQVIATWQTTKLLNVLLLHKVHNIT